MGDDRLAGFAVEASNVHKEADVAASTGEQAQHHAHAGRHSSHKRQREHASPACGAHTVKDCQISTGCGNGGQEHDGAQHNVQSHDRRRDKSRRRQDGGHEAAAVASGNASDVRLRVQRFVGRLLEPLLQRNVVDLEQYTEVLGRAVEKVMKVHGSQSDASFLEHESARISRLVDKYVDFVRHDNSKQ